MTEAKPVVGEPTTAWPQTEEEFMEAMRKTVAPLHGGGHEAEITMILTGKPPGEDTYSEGAWAMRDAALLAYRYAAHLAGASGYQASIAALDAYRAMVGIDGPFIVLRAEDLVYPQYDLRAKLEEFIEKSRPWVEKRAARLLSEDHGAATVREHWKQLVAGRRP